MDDLRRTLDDEATWDEWYAATARWSGRPNAALVAEVADLAPGTALDVGCGEGADAIWLAGRGWRVTAVDPSGVALARGRAAADDAPLPVRWLRRGILELPDDVGQHDLVLAMYAVLPRTDDDAAIAALLRAVAPGGLLLVVHHEGFPGIAHQHGDHPTDAVAPDDVAAALDGGWEIERHEVRVPVVDGASRGHPDVILRARRRRA